METKMIPCEFCKEGHSNDTGGYYDRLQCERKHYWALLQTESDPAKRREYRICYERACDTGD